MTDQTTTMELPEIGRTHEPVYAHDPDHVITEKTRSYLTRAVHVHEQNRKAQGEVEGSLPCMSLAVPCYMADLSTEGYASALRKSFDLLSTISHEAHRLGYTVLSATPAVFGVSEGETYQTPADRAPGWKLEMTATKNMPQFFDGDRDHNTLTRLWLELSIKSHGPSYMNVMQEARAGNEVQRSLQQIMGKNDLRN